MKKLLVIATLFASPLLLQGQMVEEVFKQSNRINQTGMLVLGGWALTNMAYGGYGASVFSDEKKYFHQMNLMWNIVNAGIAGFALYQLNSTDFSLFTTDQMIGKHVQTQNLYLINAGLDILYMAGGAYMIHVSKSNFKHQQRLKGYGQSVILQGGFLFVFDLAMYFLQANSGRGFSAAQQALSLSPQGIALTLNF